MEIRDDYDKERKNYVVYAKEFGRNVPFTLPTVQLKMLLYVISKIEYDDSPLREFEISITDMCRTCGINIDGGFNYKKVKADWNALYKTEFRRKGEEGGETFAFFDKCVIDDKSNTALITISANVAPYFFHQKGNYVQHMLEKTLSFTGAASIRLYMMLQSYIWKEKVKLSQPQTVSITLEHIRRVLILSPSYDTWGNMKKRIIDSSVAEINKKTDDMHVEVEYIKNRRTNCVDTVEFTVYAPSMEQVALAKEIREEYFRKADKK